MGAMINMGLIGDANGSLATGLAAQIKLVPYSGSLQTVDGVLVDGQSAAPSDTSEQVLAAVLQSGKTLVLANPTAQQLASVRAVTGCGPRGPVALLSYVKSTGGPSPYRCSMLPIATMTSRVASDMGPGTALSSNAAAQLGPAIIQAVQSQQSPAAQVGDPSGLIAPTGAIYGCSSFSSSMPWTQSAPYINNKPDDSAAKSRNQSPTGSALTEFYVYYVNGQAPPNGNTPPYYIVILRQTGSFSCGPSQVAQNENQRGWFQYQILLTPNTVGSGYGPALNTAPVAIRDPSNLLHLFCIDRTGALWTIGQDASDGGWGNWITLAPPTGVTLATLAVGSNQDGRLQVFAIDSSRSLHTIYETAPGVWSVWNVLAPPAASPSITSVAVGQDPDGCMELTAIGADGAVHHIAQTAPNNGWGGWNSLGAPSGVDGTLNFLAVEQEADNRLTVFVGGTGNTPVSCITQTTPGNGWGSWNMISNSANLGSIEAFTVERNQDGRLEVFAIVSGTVWHSWEQAPSGGTWSGWDSLGVPSGESLVVLSAGHNLDGRLEIFALDASGSLWHNWQTSPNGNWFGWASLGAPLGVHFQDLTVMLDQSGRLSVLGMAANGVLCQIQQTAPNGGTGWGDWSSTWSDSTFINGVTLLGHAPVSFSPPEPQVPVPVALQVPMTVIAQTQSGTGPVQFTATVNDATLLPDWAVADTSSGMSTSWNYHEVQAWDPTQSVPVDFHIWWQSVYPSNDKVIQLPMLSCAPANLNFEVVSAWSFASSLITNTPTSRSLWVSFTGGWVQNLAFLHNPDGCLGAEGSTHHHLFWNEAGWSWTWTIDLGQFAVPT